MKAVLTDNDVPVYSSTEDQSISIATVHSGEVMELGKVIRKKGGKVWVELMMPGGQKGYIPGEVKIFQIRKARIPGKSTDLLESPAKGAAVLKTLMRGAVVTVTGADKNDDGTFFKSTDETGTTGYISADAKMRVVPEFTRSTAIRDMVTGLIFILIGAALVVMNSKSGQASLMVYISIAVIFFGLLQGGQGVYEFLQAKKAEEQKK